MQPKTEAQLEVQKQHRGMPQHASSNPPARKQLPAAFSLAALGFSQAQRQSHLLHGLRPRQQDGPD